MTFSLPGSGYDYFSFSLENLGDAKLRKVHKLTMGQSPKIDVQIPTSDSQEQKCAWLRYFAVLLTHILPMLTGKIATTEKIVFPLQKEKCVGVFFWQTL